METSVANITHTSLCRSRIERVLRLIPHGLRGGLELPAQQIDDGRESERAQQRHEHDEDGRADAGPRVALLVGNVGALPRADRLALVGAVRAVLHAVAELTHGDADVRQGALEQVRVSAALGLVRLVRALRLAVALELLVDAVAVLAVELAVGAHRAPDLVRPVSTVLDAIAAPRQRDAVLVALRRAREVLRAAVGGGGTGALVFLQGQAVRTCAHGTAAVHDANVRTPAKSPL